MKTRRMRTRSVKDRARKPPHENASSPDLVNRKGNKHRIEHQALNTISIGGGGVDWKIQSLSHTTRSARAVEVKKSTRWMPQHKFPSAAWHLPYIDKTGKFSGYNLYKCNWEPTSIIGTVVATVRRRLFFWALSQPKNERREVYRIQRLLCRVAGYYTLSKNNYFLDRALFLLKNVRKNKSLLSKILHSYSQKLDAHKWFVYGHVCLQTKWLTSRALRPRDKSAFNQEFVNPIFGKVTELFSFQYDAIWRCCSNIVNLVQN